MVSDGTSKVLNQTIIPTKSWSVIHKYSPKGVRIESVAVDGFFSDDGSIPNASRMMMLKPESVFWNFYLLEDNDLYPKTALLNPSSGSSCFSATIQTSSPDPVQLQSSEDFQFWKTFADLPDANGLKISISPAKANAFFRLEY